MSTSIYADGCQTITVTPGDAPAEQAPSIDTIKRLCVAAYGVSLIDLGSARRDRHTVDARHVAMWLARKLTAMSLPQIGRHIGKRDHTTVLHAVRRIDRMLETEAAMRIDVAGLVAALQMPATPSEGRA